MSGKWGGVLAGDAIKQLDKLPPTSAESAREKLIQQARIAASYGDTSELILDWLKQFRDDVLKDSGIPDSRLIPIAQKAYADWWSQPQHRVKGSSSDCVLGPKPGDSCGAFPLGEVSLFQGSSGAGKTTIGVDMLIQQRIGETFWGRQTFEREFLVIMMDRSQASLERTFNRMQLDLSELPYRVLTASEMLREPADVLHDIWTQNRQVQIMFVEGLDMWCKDITDMRTVVKLLTPLQHFAEARHLAVIGTVGSPKMKARDGYKAPRDRAIGSSVWARKAETVLDIVEDHETEARHITMLTRDARPQKFTMQFDKGRLIYREPSITIGIESVTEEPVSVRQLAKQLGIGKTKAAELLRAAREGV